MHILSLGGIIFATTVAVGGASVVLVTSGPLRSDTQTPQAIASSTATATKQLAVRRLAGTLPKGVGVGVGQGRTSDGQGVDAGFVEPTGVAADQSGTLYIADNAANLIRVVSPSGFVSTLAGTGEPGLRDGPAARAQFNGPNGLAVEADGSVLVADSGNHRIRRITKDGQVTTVAGSGPSGLGRGGFADGDSLTARFNLPKGVAVGSNGDIFVADTDNLRIRRIGKDGVVTTFAGTGARGSADGTAATATFANVSGLAFGPDGSLFIADQPNNVIRRIDPLGKVTTLGTGLRFPFAVAVDKAGGIFVADTGNNRVVLLEPAGRVIAEAGGTQGSADGIGRRAQFFNPGGIAIAAAGNLLVADSTNAILRSIEVSP